MRIVHRPEGYRELRTDAGAWADVGARARRIAEACDAESSWGGYGWELITQNANEAEAHVWTFDDRGVEDNARSQRLLTNLDAGR